MRVRPRRAVRPLVIFLLALLMTGCIKLNITLQLQPDDTVNGSVIFAVNKQLLSLTGSTFDQITQGQAVLPSGVAAQTSDYSDDTYAGKEYTFENVPISRFSQSGSGGSFTIQHVNDTFVVDGTFDLSSSATGGGTSQLPQAAQLLGSADLKVTITFPGAVQTANGRIDGNMVTWTLKFGQSTPITAVGSATSSGSGVLMWILIAAAVLIVVVVVAVLLSRRRVKPPAGEGGEEPAAVSASAGDAASAVSEEPPTTPIVPASEPSPPPPPVGTTESSTPPPADAETEPVSDTEPEPVDVDSPDGPPDAERPPA